MGMKFRRSKSSGPFRFTLGKKSFSSSVGGKTFRIGLSSTGKIRMTSRIPGTGISFSTSFGGGKGRKRSKKRTSRIASVSRTPRKNNVSLSLTAWGIILLALGLILTIAMIKEGMWGILIFTIPMICIGFSMLPIDIPSIFHRNEVAEIREVTKTENGWICPDCETENSNSSSTCKGCGRYK